jgi:hypothetical protein
MKVTMYFYRRTDLKRPTFNFYRPNGSYVAFNIDSLVQYILSTGDFSDPETRIPFSDDDLERIDRLAHDEALGCPSVLAARRDPHAFSDLKFRRDALLGLERCAGEVISDMLTVIETCDPDEAQMRLLLREFPAFLDLYRQMVEADTEYALNSMRHWRLYLRGPPNCPNEDDYGLLDLTLTLMETISTTHNNGGVSPTQLISSFFVDAVMTASAAPPTGSSSNNNSSTSASSSLQSHDD